MVIFFLTMKLLRFFNNSVKQIYDWFSLWDYKIKQRRHLKKQKTDDSNIYPLW